MTVEIKGFAMTAGSTPSFSAAIGSSEPTTLANMTMNRIERLTVAATQTVTPSFCSSSPSTSSILPKFTSESVAPHSSATRHSFHMTFSASRGSISPSDRLRITAVEACAPELPPVPISIGIKATSAGTTASIPSKLVRIMLVKVAESIRNSSQGMRFFQISRTGVREYGVSEGSIPAIFSMSSVVSCSITSSTSSTVTMPTRRISLSTTGMTIRS